MGHRVSIRWLAPLALLCLASSALAAPRWVRVSLPADPAHSMYVSWNTDSVTEALVQYGIDTNYGQEVAGTTDNVGGDLGVIHSAEMIGLNPDTTYHYRVGNASDGWSDDKTFVTAPVDVCVPFTFGVAADSRNEEWLGGGSSACWQTVMEAVYDEGMGFIINSGDLVHDGKNNDEWANFLQMGEQWSGTVAIVPAIGNHDDDSVEGDGALYNRIFALPRNSANNTEDFFSFDYGNVHFACLSTQTFDFQTQYDWLEQDLAATDKMWKVVFFHVPVYSSGGHGSNEDGKTWGYIPLFDQYHVDLVLTGHDHIYERYRPMVNHQEVPSYDEGTCYMVSGGGGAFTYGNLYFPTETGVEVGDGMHHWIKMSVTNNVMHIKAERVSGWSCWNFGGQGVIDEFDIVKTLANDPCATGNDVDGDGVSTPLDCNDNDASVYPGAPETCGDGIDQNCDGQDQECPCADADGDGFEDLACGGTDCDDTDPGAYPGAIEICADGIDQDCDGETDEADCQLCTDADGDGYPAVEASCPDGRDCDDAVAEINPSAFEWCNGVDDNCDGSVDENDVCLTCQDTDGDGHDGMSAGCPDGLDCDDGNPAVYPGASEVCNGADDDCDGSVDEDDVCGGTCVDTDGDGHNLEAPGCPTGDDCNDADAAIYPGATETCNLLDDDCDDLIDEDLGQTGCGIGACAVQVPVCLDGQPVECRPASPAEQEERSCSDGIDNDCDGYADAEDSTCKSSGCGCSAAGDSPLGLLGLLGLLLTLAAGHRGRRRQ